MSYTGLWTGAQNSATGMRMSPGGAMLGSEAVSAPASAASSDGGGMTQTEATEILDGAQGFVQFGASSVHTLDQQISSGTADLTKMRQSGASQTAINKAQQQLDLKSQLRSLIVQHMQRLQEILAGNDPNTGASLQSTGSSSMPSGTTWTGLPDPSAVARTYGGQ